MLNYCHLFLIHYVYIYILINTRARKDVQKLMETTRRTQKPNVG